MFQPKTCSAHWAEQFISVCGELDMLVNQMFLQSVPTSSMACTILPASVVKLACCMRLINSFDLICVFLS